MSALGMQQVQPQSCSITQAKAKRPIFVGRPVH